jgi:dTDP-4-dehydrorhamnose 3,5-epimerase
MSLLRVIETPIAGVFVLEFEPVHDSRGYFVRRFCKKSFAEHGLCAEFEFDSSSMNTKKRTLRGLHFQQAPFEETKLVSCSRGAIFDVAVDIRKKSPSQGKWFAIELNETESKAIYIPPGCAHGFITLADSSVVDYKLKGAYSAQDARGIRFDDPLLSIKWPAQPVVVSERDRALPLLEEFIAAQSD